MTSSSARLVVLSDLTPYEEAHTLQLETVEKRGAGKIPDTLILLEHTPVITLGRNADPSGVVASKDVLEERGISVHRIERGGQATYHGPGQVVGYPIVDLHGLGIGIKQYVSNLEEMMIRAAASFGVQAYRGDGMIGIFCDHGKLGAIGVRVSQGITFHGFAFNVAPDLTHYQLIVPCGMTDTPITSIAAISGKTPTMDKARQVLIEAFAEVFGLKVV
ncbi:MAG: lipoyl(octanoyl) transferase LipB [Deltaproteobacteria bacterium]|nr:lipoyl(octanoyl) transferase LipB [Deltaproteobacteria bacterium]